MKVIVIVKFLFIGPAHRCLLYCVLVLEIWSYSMLMLSFLVCFPAKLWLLVINRKFNSQAAIDYNFLSAVTSKTSSIVDLCQTLSSLFSFDFFGGRGLKLCIKMDCKHSNWKTISGNLRNSRRQRDHGRPPSHPRRRFLFELDWPRKSSRRKKFPGLDRRFVIHQSNFFPSGSPLLSSSFYFFFSTSRAGTWNRIKQETPAFDGPAYKKERQSAARALINSRSNAVAIQPNPLYPNFFVPQNETFQNINTNHRVSIFLTNRSVGSSDSVLSLVLKD